MGVLPHGVGVLPTYGTRRPFLAKNNNVVLFLQYHVFYQENLCIPKIWRVFGFRSFSRSFIHWLLRYETRFLEWASCPTLPYCWSWPPKKNELAWWRHQMETFSALLAICAGTSPVSGEFPTQRPVTRGFDVFFDLRLNKRLSKQSWGWWLETLSWSLWRQSNGTGQWPIEASGFHHSDQTSTLTGSQQIGASVCSRNFRVHDVLIWNHFEFTPCSITT